jgi:DNA-binding beta-propeller fold protein YncE
MATNFRPAILYILLISLAFAGCATRTARTAPAAPPASAWQNAASATAPITVANWTKPKSGWLYILDPQPVPKSLSGRILLMDPETSQLMGNITTGDNPDFALSPDGAHLFVASRGNNQQSNLAEIDTSSGTVLGTTTVENRVVSSGLPPYSSMAISGDGLALRVLVNVPTAPVTDGFQIVTFDARSGDLLPGLIHLGNCGYGHFINYVSADEFDFLCPTTNRIRHIRLDAKSRELDNSFVVLPWARRLGAAQAFLAPGGQTITIVRGDGTVYSMDLATGTFATTPLHGDVQGLIPPAAWPASRDGQRLYVGYCHPPNPRFYLDFDRSATDSPRTQAADELRVFNTATWREVGKVRAGTSSFWTAVLSNDGKSLYALSPESHSVAVYDATTLRELRSIEIGGAPALAIVAP